MLQNLVGYLASLRERAWPGKGLLNLKFSWALIRGLFLCPHRIINEWTLDSQEQELVTSIVSITGDATVCCQQRRRSPMFVMDAFIFVSSWKVTIELIWDLETSTAPLLWGISFHCKAFFKIRWSCTKEDADVALLVNAQRISWGSIGRGDEHRSYLP